MSETLAAAGFTEIMRARSAGVDLVDAVRRLAPDLVMFDMALPDRDALEGVRALSSSAPRPIVMFSDKDDPAFVEDAIAAGVCSYNLAGVSDRDMKAIVASAVALFRRYAKVETELAAATAQLEERRVIERAKALLMADAQDHRAASLPLAAQQGDERESPHRAGRGRTDQGRGTPMGCSNE